MSFINKIKEIRKSNQEAGYNDLGAMLKGKWSLARTFWGYWFLCNIIINIIYSFTEKNSSLVLLGVFSLYLGATAFIGVKNTQAENKKWKFFALILISIDFIVSLVVFLADLFYKQISTYAGGIQ